MLFDDFFMSVGTRAAETAKYLEIANGSPSQTPPATTAFVTEKEIQVLTFLSPPITFLGLTKFR